MCGNLFSVTLVVYGENTKKEDNFAVDQTHIRDSGLIPLSLKEGLLDASNVKVSKKRLKDWEIRES